MTRSYYIIISILISVSNCLGQVDTLTYFQKMTGEGYASVSAFYIQYDNFIPLSKSNLNIDKLNCIGIDYLGIFNVNRRHGINSSYAYYRYLPQEILIDSLKYKLTGYYASILFWGKDWLYQSKKFDVIHFLGFQFGSITATNTEAIRYKNQYFLPTIAVQPQISFNRMIFNLRLSSGFDISRFNWKTNREQTKELPDFSLTNLRATFGLAWNLYK